MFKHLSADHRHSFISNSLIIVFHNRDVRFDQGLFYFVFVIKEPLRIYMLLPII